MSIPFEAKYIQINYLNKNIIGSIKESKYVLPIEILDNSEYIIDAITYSKLDTGESGQLAFRILDDTIEQVPYFLNASNIDELISVKDPDSGQIWWIENGSWKSTKNKNDKKIVYRDSIICRTVGESKLHIANTICLVHIHSSSFSHSQLSVYLEDFKALLSELIFSEGSYVFAPGKEKKIKIANKKFLNQLTEFIKYTEKIIENPKKELREKQAIKSYRKVKPIPKTFMEIATKGIKKELTSRDYIESYDVAENRYIYSIINRIYILLNTLSHITERRIDTLRKEVANRTKRLSQLSTNKISISQEACESHILDLKRKVQKEKEKCIEINNTKISSKAYYINDEFQSFNNLQTLYIQATGKLSEYSNHIQFYGKEKSSSGKDWFELENGHSLQFEFDSSMFDGYFKRYGEYKVIGTFISSRCEPKSEWILHTRRFNNVYKISPVCRDYKICIKVTSIPRVDEKDENIISFFGDAKKSRKDHWHKSQNGKSFLFKFDRNIFDGFFNMGNEYEIIACIAKKKTFLVEFFKVDNVTILYSNIENDVERYSQEVKILEKNNWKRFLTDDEEKDHNCEKESISKILNLIDQTINENEDIFGGFQHILPKLQKVRTFFKKNKVRMNSHFPGSMTFIQNSNYLGAHKLYKQIKDASGISEDLFDIWRESEEIGILDIPTIYERWCLLQIIKILKEKYGFTPISGEWKTNLLQQIVKNKYGVKLLFENKETGRRIRLFYEKTLDNGKRPDFIIDARSLDNNISKFNRFIMDAKFREDVTIPGEISDLMYNLYHEKDYSENNNNFVYILHPSIKAIRKMKTPQDWGKNSYYGEDILLDEEKYPNHKYGAVLVSPFYEDYTSNLDDLHRLLGLFLQYGAENNKDLQRIDKESNIIDAKPKEKIFCLVCGSDNCDVKPDKAGRNRNNRKYICTCLDCQHYFVITYCGSCRNRLWKHGRYWTYHKTHAFEPYNIQCPSCGELIAQRKAEDEIHTIH